MKNFIDYLNQEYANGSSVGMIVFLLKALFILCIFYGVVILALAIHGAVLLVIPLGMIGYIFYKYWKQK